MHFQTMTTMYVDRHDTQGLYTYVYTYVYTYTTVGICLTGEKVLTSTLSSF